jgi:hypothetical protein
VNIKQLIEFLQAQPDPTKEVFVQTGNRAHPIVTAEKGYVFLDGKLINKTRDPFFPDDWHRVETEGKEKKIKAKQKEVLLLVDALDAFGMHKS